MLTAVATNRVEAAIAMSNTAGSESSGTRVLTSVRFEIVLLAGSTAPAGSRAEAELNALPPLPMRGMARIIGGEISVWS
jgi:hypothetical protein